ncbi:MAG: hypothetical protein ACJ781_10455 [Myxococcales bacterium]
MRLISIVACAALVLSCGGSDAPVQRIGGVPFTARDATAGVVSLSALGIAAVQGSTAVIGISSVTSLCSRLAAGKEAKSAQYLVLAPFRLQPDRSTIPPPAPGIYVVGGLAIDNAVAAFSTTDATCVPVAATTVRATSGQINLTAVGSRYTGSYDLNFGADHVSGNFDAPVCSGVDPIAVGQGSLACE